MSPAECRHRFGGTDSSRFGEPMLWIGIYAAIGNLACTAAMAVDVMRSFKWKKLWIPSKFFVLNAAVLTLLGIAVKIPNDINGPMPGMLDQLAKLSGIIFVCVAMNHSMPSLGVMEGGDLLSNMVALGILVVSTAINIWYQTRTKLITNYASANLLFTVVMLLIYAITVSHSLSVTTVKTLLEKQYMSKHEKILQEVDSSNGCVLSTEKLRSYVKRYWLLALTSSPDYVLRASYLRSATLYLIWPLSLYFIVLLIIQSKLRERGCYVNSDYKWSVGVIFLLQIVAVIMGMLSSVLQIHHLRGCQRVLAFKALFTIEEYRLQKIHQWKADPLPFHVHGRRDMIVARQAKYLALHLVVFFQRLVAFLTRAIIKIFNCTDLIFRWPFILLLAPFHFCIKGGEGVRDGSAQQGGGGEEEVDFSDYIVILESTDDAKERARRWKDYPDRWLRSGRDKQPKHLLNLFHNNLRKPTVRTPRRVLRARRSWSLQLANMECIIRTASRLSPDGDTAVWVSLIKAMDECFSYSVVVDGNNPEILKKEVDAARMVREDRVVSDRWMDVRLTGRKTIEELGKRANDLLREWPSEEDRDKWPLAVFAAESMHETIVSVLRPPALRLSLEEMEAEAFGLAAECLGDLPLAILKECSRGRYGSREEHVRFAARLLGQIESILKLLESNLC